MVRPSGPNLANLPFYCRKAAEALKARNIPAQGKRAESARRPGYNGDYVRVPRPLWPQSAKLTGAKEAMELGKVFPVMYIAPYTVFFRPPYTVFFRPPFQGSFQVGPYPGRRSAFGVACPGLS